MSFMMHVRSSYCQPLDVASYHGSAMSAGVIRCRTPSSSIEVNRRRGRPRKSRKDSIK